jgi:hypothetical protein
MMRYASVGDVGEDLGIGIDVDAADEVIALTEAVMLI